MPQWMLMKAAMSADSNMVGGVCSLIFFLRILQFPGDMLLPFAAKIIHAIGDVTKDKMESYFVGGTVCFRYLLYPPLINNIADSFQFSMFLAL